jgi:hypothetical protein
MDKNVKKAWTRWIGGISDFDSEGAEGEYYFGRSVDVRSNPREIKILPRTVKESGTVVIDLIKWGDVYDATMDLYAYGDAGNIYKRTSARSWSLLRTVANSHGNGMIYNPEDDYLHYTSDKVLGRYGPLSGTPTFADDFLGAQGGVPLNTASIDFEASSSRYATASDSATLSITGDITIEGYFKPESLPAVAEQMVLVSKWNGNSDERSYKFDLAAISGYFGDGTDGALTISVNTTEAPIDSSCSGTINTTSLSATNASFAVGQIILIHQSRGTGAGTWQRNQIQSYTAGTITLETALNATYTDSGASQAQVRVLKQYTNVTINSGITYTCKAWDGNVGGIIGWLANGTTTSTGTITANGNNGSSGNDPAGGAGIGFRGGQGLDGTPTITAYQGEGTAGASSQSQSANGNGGGAGSENAAPGGEAGGGGGNGTAGSNATTSRPGLGGSTAGSADLTTMVFGGGGGGGAREATNNTGSGGGGGGIIFITSADLVVTGAITSNGGNGGDPSGNSAAGGGGAGGSILFKVQTATLGSSLVTATAGSGGNGYAGAGGVGRIHLDYYTSYTGTTSPTLDATQDGSLVTNTTYQLRFSVSATDGTSGNSETLAKALTVNPEVDTWYHWAVAWDASASSAEFFVNAVSIGTDVGTKTSIYDSTALFAIGASFSDAGSAEKFFDGKVDEVRIWNDLRTVTELNQYKETEIAVNSANLQAYYQVDSTADDSTANANNLTLVNSPVYDTADVPFASPTTRQDLDQSLDTSGQTYAVPTAISEAATGRQTFTPSKDPQKSIQVLVADTGDDADWTLTVHDAQNRVIATSTITHANMTTGDVEFTFPTPWRPLTNFTNEYHFHLTVTSTTGTPAVTTTSNNDLETVDFHTYYQFLVEQTAWHPMARFLNFLVIGNERYVGTYEATLYDPHTLVLPANWTVRCFGYWQEYLAIGVFKGDNIYDFDYGRVYFWDGANPDRPNYWIDIPEGGINALWGTQGKLYIWAGYQGELLVYEGGPKARKLKKLPFTLDTEHLEVYPQAVGMWKSLLRYGVSGGDVESVNRAVYTYGSTNEKYPDALTCDYPISTGNYLDTVKIGMIIPFNKELLVSWQDNVSYGVDYINSSNNPFPTAFIEMIVEDLGVPYKEKQALELVTNFEALESGETVASKYKNEETDTDWNTDSDSTSEDDIVHRRLIENGRYNNMHIALDLSTTGSTSPTVKSILLVSDPLTGEERYG